MERAITKKEVVRFNGRVAMDLLILLQKDTMVAIVGVLRYIVADSEASRWLITFGLSF